MNLYTRRFPGAEQTQGPLFSEPGIINLDKIFSAVRRQWKVVATLAACGAGFGLLYAITAIPLYKATTAVLIDRSNSGLVDQLSALGNTDDEGSVLSQVEVLESDAIGFAVVDRLGLSRDSRFMAPATLTEGVRARLRSMTDVSSWFVADNATAPDDQQLRLAALGRLKPNTAIERVGRTYVLTITYTSPYPDLAAKVSLGIAQQYITDKLDSKYEATRRASEWLQERIAELKTRSLESDLAVQKYRAENNLVSDGQRLVSDQKVSELNSALIVAQATTAQAQAKLDRIKRILADGQSDAIVTDVLESTISNTLRSKYLDASKREAEISRLLGPDHVQAARLRKEMAEYKRLMFEELRRIAESFESDVDVAKARESDLQRSVAAAVGASNVAGESLVQLRELERESETYRNLYQSFLQRYQQTLQQQSFPITEARIISAARPPGSAGYPRKPLILVLGLMIGAVAGAGVGAMREFRDRFFRTADEVNEYLQLEFIGSLPLVASKRLSENVADRPPKSIWKSDAIANYTVDHPFSSFSETLRNAKIAVDFQGSSTAGKTIGIVSAFPNEGKSTFSVNFAEILAKQGARTVLVDADIRNPGATRLLGRHAEIGLLEILTENKTVSEALLKNHDTNMLFLPTVVKRRISHSAELLSSSRMTSVLTQLKANCDYVILDLPPIAPIVDARAIAPQIDAFILVLEWGKTARQAAVQALLANAIVSEKCIGVVLNKVDKSKMSLYRRHGSIDQYISKYDNYYTDD